MLTGAEFVAVRDKEIWVGYSVSYYRLT